MLSDFQTRLYFPTKNVMRGLMNLMFILSITVAFESFDEASAIQRPKKSLMNLIALNSVPSIIDRRLLSRYHILNDDGHKSIIDRDYTSLFRKRRNSQQLKNLRLNRKIYFIDTHVDLNFVEYSRSDLQSIDTNIINNNRIAHH
ncbi:hypothetical protein DICVIV_04981 [Dictyocaulus viviparus]|uniref:Uncharacterized protein n=1 Tax=Dictyocaulus viviparus TaxID=29172 RepID=A0A0D8Y2V4_DICVI|nr:hypothetical protein DICVIV_04981 [Dictyocaulus viviparus]